MPLFSSYSVNLSLPGEQTHESEAEHMSIPRYDKFSNKREQRERQQKASCSLLCWGFHRNVFRPEAPIKPSQKATQQPAAATVTVTCLSSLKEQRQEYCGMLLRHCKTSLKGGQGQGGQFGVYNVQHFNKRVRLSHAVFFSVMLAPCL